MKYNIVLVDLDETLFDSTQRIQEATINGEINWDVAMDSERVKYDPVIEGAVKAVNKIADMGFIVCYLTGRSEKCYQGTLIALKNAGFPVHIHPYEWLEMRKIDDLRRSHVIKGEVIERFLSHSDKLLVAAMDDDFSGMSKEMYYSNNIPHFYEYEFDSLIKYLQDFDIDID